MMVGDNVYYIDFKIGEWFQENCVYSKLSGEQDQLNIFYDIGIDWVLILEEFYYFGVEVLEVLVKLFDQIGY